VTVLAATLDPHEGVGRVLPPLPRGELARTGQRDVHPDILLDHLGGPGRDVVVADAAAPLLDPVEPGACRLEVAEHQPLGGLEHALLEGCRVRVNGCR